MRTRMTLAILVAAVTPAVAQEWDVARRQYTFIDTRLTVEVRVDVGGTLRLIRGMPGQIEVAGRARNGFTSFGLGDRHGSHLRLSAVGANRVEYMVVVPERVYVRVELPGREVSEVFGSTRDAATYDWESVAEPEAPMPRAAPAPPSGETERRAVEPLPGDPGRDRAAGTPTPGLFTTYRDAVAPEVVTLPRADVVRTLSVRLEGDAFRVAASRPMNLRRGDPDALEIRPAGPPMDIVIAVPRRTADFLVEVAGAPAFAIVEGRPMALCTPAMEQVLEDGRLWFTFTPLDGRLDCSEAAAERARKGS